MARIRFGVIGCGGMGTVHLDYMVKMRTVRVTAVCDAVEQRANEAAAKCDGKAFLDYRDLITSGLVDAVLVATPHYQHPEISIFAMNHGIHVLCEKPIGVTLTPVDELVATARRTGVRFGVVFQKRTVPAFQKARKMIQAGELGELHRVYYLAPGYRSQAYYDSDPWRGTWRDEGGGVLINQAPHYTDMLWWLAGDPAEIIGKIQTTLHRIEVEDEAEALLGYPNGASGYYCTATAEAPGMEYVRIVGDKATLEIRGEGSLRIARLETPLREFTLHSKAKWGAPKSEWKDIPCPPRKEVGHRAIAANFVRAINNPKVELVAPGVEGIHQVEISCAIILSSMTGKPVRLPVDRAEYDRLMAKLVRTSARRTKTHAVKDSGVRFFT